MQLARLLSQQIELEEDVFDVMYADGWAIDGDGDVLLMLYQQFQSTYQQRSLEERVKALFILCKFEPQPELVSLARTLLGDELLEPVVCKIQDLNGRTLLHHAARALGYLAAQSFTDDASGLATDQEVVDDGSNGLPTRTINKRLKAHEVMIRRLLTVDCEVHKPVSELWGGPRSSTALIDILHVCLEYIELFWYVRRCNLLLFREILERGPSSAARVALQLKIPLKLWLDILTTSGIDLIRYGKEEQFVHRSIEPIEFFCDRWNVYTRHGYLKLRLLVFDYGPSPNDWKLWLIDDMDDSFTDFWDMIDHPERAMPGALEESFDSY